MKLTLLSTLTLVALAFATSTNSFAASKIGGLNANETITVTFDSFCDGMTITPTSSALVGGSLTGCLAGSGIAAGNVVIDFVAAPFGSTPGTGINMVSTALPGEVVVYLLDFSNLTWANYLSVMGEVPSLINSGTFTINGIVFNQNAGPSTVKSAK